jgi:hypothetical protein
MSDDVLRLFDGLNEKQIRQFRREIVPTLQNLRDNIISNEQAKTDKQGKNKQRLQNGKMQRKNTERKTL